MDRFGHEEARYAHAGQGCRPGVSRYAEAAVAYLRSRTVEHWLMFLAGLALGALLG